MRFNDLCVDSVHRPYSQSFIGPSHFMSRIYTAIMHSLPYGSLDAFI